MQILHKTILLFLLLSLVHLSAQAQDAPKTIYELYNLPTGGCVYDIPKTIEKQVVQDVFIDGSFPIETITKKENTPILKEINAALKVFKKALKKRKSTSISDKKVLSNGNYCFLKKGKWGFKNAQGEVIHKPQFDFVQLDTIAGGFVGFQEVFCNYYDGETGGAKFEEDYYYIKAEGKETFIIQSKNGFGLIQKGEVIVNPTNIYVKREEQSGVSYYHITQREGEYYLLLDDLKTKISIKSPLSKVFITEAFLLLEDSFLNLKTKQKLVCEEGYSIRLIDVHQQLLSIRKEYSVLEYLIDFNGNIISNQGFSAIGKSNNGVSIVSITETTAQNKKVEKRGLINMQGNWVVRPNQYKSIFAQGEYYIVKDYDDKKGMIDAKGNVVLPVTYGFVEGAGNYNFLYGDKHKNGVNSKIVAMPSGKVIKESLSYMNIRSSKSCDNGYFIAYLQTGQQIVDENYNPITPVYDYVSFNKKYLLGKINNKIKKNKDNEYELFTCDGERIYFEIEGEKLGTFNAVKELTEELTYVYLGHEIGYLIPSKGKTISFNYRIRTHQEVSFGDFIIIGTLNSNEQGLIDENGEIVLPFIFKNIKKKPEGEQWIQFTAASHKKGLFSTKGELFGGRLFDNITYMGLGLYNVQEGTGANEKRGVMNREGKRVLPIGYDLIYSTGGLIFTKNGDTHQVFDRTGKQLK